MAEWSALRTINSGVSGSIPVTVKIFFEVYIVELNFNSKLN